MNGSHIAGSDSVGRRRTYTYSCSNNRSFYERESRITRMSAVGRIGACGQVTPNENRPIVDFGLPEKGLGYAGKIADFVGHFKFKREIRAGRAVNTGPEPGRGSAGSDAGGSRSSCPTSRAAHDLFVAAAPDIRVTGCCASAAPLDQLRMFPPLLRVAGLRCGPWLGVVGVVDAACHHPPRLAH
jgi:hypothetical protein